MRFSEAAREALTGSDARIVITGARGWIGNAMVSMLESVFTDRLHERVVLFGSEKNVLHLQSGIKIAVEPISEIVNFSGGDYLLAHLAFLTREYVQPYGIHKYVEINRKLSSTVQDFVRRTPPSGLFVPSSGAIYDQSGLPEVDLLRNPYGYLKRQDEINFLALDSDNSRKALIRIFNLSGPFLNKPNGYMLGSILQDLARGTVVNISADHEVTRSYVHVRDVVEIAFEIMLGLAPSPGIPFDTAGEREVEIHELAMLAAQVLEVPNVTINRPAMNLRKQRDYYVGDGQVLMELAKSQELTLAPLVSQIQDTADYLSR